MKDKYIIMVVDACLYLSLLLLLYHIGINLESAKPYLISTLLLLVFALFVEQYIKHYNRVKYNK